MIFTILKSLTGVKILNFLNFAKYFEIKRVSLSEPGKIILILNFLQILISVLIKFNSFLFGSGTLIN